MDEGTGAEKTEPAAARVRRTFVRSIIVIERIIWRRWSWY